MQSLSSVLLLVVVLHCVTGDGNYRIHNRGQQVDNVIDRMLRQFVSKLGRRTTSEMTDKEREDIVDLHNQLRGNEGSSNMEKLKWSDELAEHAQKLANTCKFHHAMMEWEDSTYESCGQNLYLGSQQSIEDGTMSWFNEKDDYRYGKGCNSGKVCGHYTQLVWAESREVGCGIHFCESGTKPLFGNGKFTNKWYLACNYGPRGNMAGVAPFEKGSACSNCQGGSSFCQNDLCVSGGCTGDCECNLSCDHGTLDESQCACKCENGYTGISCEDECRDFDDQCGALNNWPKSRCGESQVSRGCPLQCGVCVPKDGNTCRDTDEHCGKNPGWPTTQYCDMFDFVKEACPKFCGTC